MNKKTLFVAGSIIAVVAFIIFFSVRQTLSKDLKNLIGDSSVSVYVKDLKTGKEYGVNENRTYLPASMLKVPLMVAYLKESEVQPDIFNTTAVFTPELALKAPSEAPYPPITDPMVVGQSYSVNNLLTRLIKDSDNNASAILEAYLPQQQLIDTISNLLGKTYIPNSPLSPKEYIHIFETIHKGTYLSSDMSAKALDLATDTNFKDGIVAGIPQDIKVAHKYGIYRIESEKEMGLNDCGIVYAADPYEICVMTIGPSIEQDSKIIKSISTIVYTSLTSK